MVPSGIGGPDGLQMKRRQGCALLPINPNRGAELFFPGCSVLTLLLFIRKLRLADTRHYYPGPETSGGTQAGHV